MCHTSDHTSQSFNLSSITFIFGFREGMETNSSLAALPGRLVQKSDF